MDNDQKHALVAIVAIVFIVAVVSFISPGTGNKLDFSKAGKAT